ncbi:hypothetical protein NLJ89_g2943 [Agrocybe chaxingu]|uniref:Major facilitator superfamily (MFS) profile domain-containing protein n=1 Tax=Agrocybe chaxingu TaxID=84603 RepID=A0A9W8K3G3_9AGAR|nr:hypothetical protein NLJ89_g2943 [Agrocybe chaxingu]
MSEQLTPPHSSRPLGYLEKDDKAERRIDDSTAELPAIDQHFPTKEYLFIPIPTHLRYNPAKPFKFSYATIVLYAFTTMIIVANLYYCQPLLIEMSQSFGVSYERVSRIPTLLQAGQVMLPILDLFILTLSRYAVGLLLICPLGDIVRRRQLILFLVLVTLLLTIGLAVTTDVVIFETLSSLMGLLNVAAQILVPLVAEIAPPDQRAFAFSIVLTGLMFGILVARVIAGIIGQFIVWRIVYYTAFGAQCLAFLCLHFILPDYPAKNGDLPYWKIHWSMAKLAVTEPIAVQVILINLGASACFAYFWVTLTFLLGASPYNYSTLEIGLFGFIGMAGVAGGPLSGRLIDRMHPWHALLIATTLLLVFQAVQTAAGGIHISAVIVACFGLDFMQQVQNVGLVIMIFSISKAAISRLNAIYMISFYVGQMIGTAVGTSLFVRYGWRAAAIFGMAMYVMQIIVLLLRGPHCRQYTWFGYEGGLSFQKVTETTTTTESVEASLTVEAKA